MSAFYQSTHSISIKAPPEKVYAALTDWALRAQWRPGIDMEWEGETAAVPGQKVTFKVHKGLCHYSFSFRVTGLEPPRRFYMEYTGVPLKGRSAFEIAPEKDGCRVEFHWMKVEPGGVLARIYFALGFGMRSHRVETQKTLRMLKEYLEKTP